MDGYWLAGCSVVWLDGGIRVELGFWVSPAVSGCGSVWSEREKERERESLVKHDTHMFAGLISGLLFSQ